MYFSRTHDLWRFGILTFRPHPRPHYTAAACLLPQRMTTRRIKGDNDNTQSITVALVVRRWGREGDRRAGCGAGTSEAAYGSTMTNVPDTLQSYADSKFTPVPLRP